jgi:FkbM family methyltransferase
MKNLIRLLNFVWRHPLNQKSRMAAIGRVIRWQIASRLLPGPIALPYLNGKYLFAKNGTTSAVGNWYCGLDEYEDMSFVLDMLNSGELFVDVGANIGSYSILAATKGAEVIAIEPIPSTFKALNQNILFNEFNDLIKTVNIGLGNKKDILEFSTDQGTMNHVLKKGEDVKQMVKVQVQVRTLDDELNGRVPKIIKIDTEGFETNVIEGAKKTLINPNLFAVIIEINGNGANYGFDDEVLHQKMLSFNFDSYIYDPSTKKLISLKSKRNENKNTIYIRNNYYKHN